MAFLLDTHAFLWFASADSQLPAHLKELLEDINQPCFLSSASLWEITIKQQIGKLNLQIPLKELFVFADRNQFEIIPTTYEHLLTLSKLPNHHNDPFDRLIISQAISENLTVISKDKEFGKYKVKLKWS